MARTKSKNGEASPLQELYNYFSSPVNLEKDERISGLIGWAAIISFVVAYDIYSIRSRKIETLTRSFWRMSEHKVMKFPVLTTWILLSVHLMAEKGIRRKVNK